jgi:transcriptional regulator with XRE-family HTH domain
VATKTEKKAQKAARGAALARALEEKAAQLKLNQRETCEMLGLNPAYYSLLLSGERWFGTVAEDKMQKIADFLELPLVSVFMLAEIIKPEDFFRPTSLEKQVDQIFDHLRRDSRFATVVPAQEDWKKTPLGVRLLAALLYSDVSQIDLLERMPFYKVVPEGSTQVAATARGRLQALGSRDAAAPEPSESPAIQGSSNGESNG